MTVQTDEDTSRALLKGICDGFADIDVLSEKALASGAKRVGCSYTSMTYLWWLIYWLVSVSYIGQAAWTPLRATSRSAHGRVG
jgi:hypothetical protein